MKVSFMVTFYNQEDYVRDSFESILHIKKNYDWEVLIGDDGSDDNTVDRIKEFTDKYPEHFFLYEMPRDSSELNYGFFRQSSNILNLLSKVTGDLFCLLDGDDFYCDETFVLEAIKKFTFDKELEVVAFSCRMYDGEYKNTRGRLCKSDGYVNRRHYILNCYTPAGACVFKRIDIANISQWKKMECFTDNDILISHLMFGKMYYIDKSVYAYRIDPKSLSHRRNEFEKNLVDVLDCDMISYYSPVFKKEVERRYLSSIINMIIDIDSYRGFIKEELLNRFEIKAKQVREVSGNSNAYKILSGNKAECVKLLFILFILHPFYSSKYIIKRVVKSLKTKVGLIC